MPWLGARHANPSSIHSRGAAAAKALDEARERVGLLVGASADQIVFTSGATEANNHAVRGAARPTPPRVVSTMTIATPATTVRQSRSSTNSAVSSTPEGSVAGSATELR